MKIDMLLPPPFCQSTRNARLDSAPGMVYDVLIIGGGITGAGIARDAAMRGLRTALVEKDDLASGTSSRSSKLVHGGLRYLEHYEFGLVFESVSERALLRRLAPHLVRPIPFVFPGYKGDRVPLAMMEAGVTLYDVLSFGRTYRLHRRHNKRSTSALEPTLRRSGLKGALMYYDCATDDARLTLATALSAHDHGAHIFTRLKAEEIRSSAGTIEGIEATDQLTGESVTLNARVVICALGPWTDRFLTGNRNVHRPLLRPTKGVHIVVPRDRLPVNHAVVITGPDDGRMMFAIPWESHTYVGTTDTDFDGDPDDVFADADDIAYLLYAIGHSFPGTDITADDILGTWAGLRPLVSDDAEHASSVSREHKLMVSDDGLITIAGGKLTTYRRMGAEVLEAARDQLKAKSVHLDSCTTHTAPLVGGGTPPEVSELEQTLGADLCDHFRDRFGSDWDAIGRLAAEDESMCQPLEQGLPYVMAEIVHAITEEGALSLDDLLGRRTDILLKAKGLGLECLDQVAATAARQLDWDEERTEVEKANYRYLVQRNQAFRS